MKASAQRKARRVSAPRATAMIFADASLCAQSGAAGWGAWVKRDGGVSEVFGGAFRDRMRSSTEAELAAIANALHRALAWHLIEPHDVVMVQSDSVNALARIRKAVSGSLDNPARNGLTVGVARRTKAAPLILAAAERIAALVDQFELTVVTRHVRSHTKGGGRQWVNAECDRLAKRHMRARRAEATPPAEPSAEGVAA